MAQCALMSFVKCIGHGLSAPGGFSREDIEMMIVQREGRSRKTSVSKL